MFTEMSDVDLIEFHPAAISKQCYLSGNHAALVVSPRLVPVSSTAIYRVMGGGAIHQTGQARAARLPGGQRTRPRLVSGPGEGEGVTVYSQQPVHQ